MSEDGSLGQGAVQLTVSEGRVEGSDEVDAGGGSPYLLSIEYPLESGMH
jgi:hypothetical protein